jgi:chromosome segregation ATPase
MKMKAYRKLIADLERELLEIDRDLESVEEQRAELEARRREIVEGLNGIRKIMEGD